MSQVLKSTRKEREGTAESRQRGAKRRGAVLFSADLNTTSADQRNGPLASYIDLKRAADH
jgi:hypothetical protein